MTALEKDILSALLDLERSVAGLRTVTPKPDLAAHFVRLDDLTRRLPRSADRNLLHYLHNKSYEKARLFLEGREAENARGACR